MFTRRQFIQSSSAAAIAVALSHSLPIAQAEYKTRPRKAVLGGIPREEQMENWLKLGIEGLVLSGGISADLSEQTGLWAV